MQTESSTLQAAHAFPLREVTGLLRKYFSQDFSVFDVSEGRVLHAAGEVGLDMCPALASCLAEFGQEACVVHINRSTAHLVIPLGRAGHRNAAAVGIFRTSGGATGDDADAAGGKPAADMPGSLDPTHLMPTLPKHTLVRLGQLMQDKLAADFRVAQLEFEVEQLGEGVGESYEEISLLYRIVERVRDIDRVEELAQFVLDWAISLLPAEQAIVQVFDHGANVAVGNTEFRSMGEDHLDGDSFGALIEFTAPDAEGRPLVINADSTQVPSWPFPTVRELIVVPLRSDQCHAGWLAVINHADGGWLGTQQARLLEAAATLLGMRLMMNDLGELRKVAEASSSIKDRILANLSHELRTPLNGILGFSRLLLDDAWSDEAECREGLEAIEQCGQRLTEIVEDLLQLHALESNAVCAQKVPCRLDEVIQGVISRLAPRAADRGLTLEATGVAATLGVIYSDPQRLTQLLTILVGNSIKFTKQGGTRIESRMIQANDGLHLQLTVLDTGVGIPPDKLEAIFDPFVQGDLSSTRAHGGLGLGLAICQRIARSLGGTLTASNRPEGGSQFSLELGEVLLSSPDADPVVDLIPDFQALVGSEVS